MAIIKAFRGIRHNVALVGDLGTVVTQPYDRIGPDLQERYYRLNEANVVRLIKGKESRWDGDGTNVYTRARGYLKQWLRDGILIREDRPALYVLHQELSLPSGESATRKALICALELVPLDEGTVLPHERTLSGPKLDRLNLTRATQAYFGNIFMLYPDPENRVDALLAPAIDRPPDADFRELYENSVRQTAWVVTDPAVIAAVTAEMAPKRNLIIADGHHRYETALNYQVEQRGQHPDSGRGAAFNHAMVALVSMSNPGLTILPTHRLIYGYRGLDTSQLLERAAEYLNVEPVPNRAALEARMQAALGQVGCIGLVSYAGLYVLTLRDSAVMERLAPGRAQAWRELDVSILHEVILEHLMGLTKESIERKENLQYLREPDSGYEDVTIGEAQFLFILNPTRMDQVITCTQVGEKMPQKSTDFYPKVITGLAFLPVGPEERL